MEKRKKPRYIKKLIAENNRETTTLYNLNEEEKYLYQDLYAFWYSEMNDNLFLNTHIS